MLLQHFHAWHTRLSVQLIIYLYFLYLCQCDDVIVVVGIHRLVMFQYAIQIVREINEVGIHNICSGLAKQMLKHIVSLSGSIYSNQFLYIYIYIDRYRAVYRWYYIDGISCTINTNSVQYEYL